LHLTVPHFPVLHFFRAMLWISAVYAIVRCPSVRLYVAFVYSIETNKHIFNNLSPSGSHDILVFFSITYLMAILVVYPSNIPTGTPPHNGGVECRWGIKIAILDQYLALALITAGPSRVVNIWTVQYGL